MSIDTLADTMNVSIDVIYAAAILDNIPIYGVRTERRGRPGFIDMAYRARIAKVIDRLGGHEGMVERLERQRAYIAEWCGLSMWALRMPSTKTDKIQKLVRAVARVMETHELALHNEYMPIVHVKNIARVRHVMELKK